MRTVSRRTRATALAALAAVVVSATPTAALAAPPAVTVEVRSISYEPSELTVPRGTRVRWVNVTSPDRVHDVISSIPDLFESERFGTGERFTYRFDAGGTFTYICSIHDVMIGAVHVPLTGRVVDGPEGPVIRLRLATQPLPSDSPFLYVVRRRDPGMTAFAKWRSTRRDSLDFVPTAAGTYEFVMRIRNRAAGHVTGPAGDSPVLSVEWPD
jgi:plastocyanin